MFSSSLRYWNTKHNHKPKHTNSYFRSPPIFPRSAARCTSVTVSLFPLIFQLNKSLSSFSIYKKLKSILLFFNNLHSNIVRIVLGCVYFEHEIVLFHLAVHSCGYKALPNLRSNAFRKHLALDYWTWVILTKFVLCSYHLNLKVFNFLENIQILEGH